MSRSRTPGTPSRVEARRKKTARTRIVLCVTAAAAAVAVGVAVADSNGDDHTDQRAGGAAGTASTAGETPTAAPTDAAPTGTPEASASMSTGPSGTPDNGATASTPPAGTATPTSSAPAKSAAAQPAKPAPKPSPTKSSGSGGSGGSGTVNADAESAVLALVNKERAAAGCGPLATNAKLSTAARTYSDTMARSGVMSHTGPDGSTMAGRVEAAGYQWSRLGENIARGQADADAVMNAWMNSSGHRANILNCDFREIGIGVHKGDGGPWWTQDFGTGK